MEIEQDLGPGASGDQVRALHEAIAELAKVEAIAAMLAKPDVRTVYERERTRDFYGEVTAYLISDLQKSQNLRPSGVVDEPTRELIARLRRERDSPQPAEPDGPPQGTQPPHSVAGVVVDACGRPLEGVAVAVLRVRPGGRDVELGRGSAERGGVYDFGYDPRSDKGGDGPLNIRTVAVKGEATLGRSCASSDNLGQLAV